MRFIDHTKPHDIVWMASSAAASAATAAVLLAPGAAIGATYLSDVQAQASLFPQATSFAAQLLKPTPEQLELVKARLGQAPVTGFMHVSEAQAGTQRLGWFVTDSVIGKFEMIDYAVALSPTGEILGVEIMSYRESHGSEVRMPAWRRQFVGKTASAPLAIGNDIANISGATLSATHLTEGIRRIAVLAQVVLAH